MQRGDRTAPDCPRARTGRSREFHKPVTNRGQNPTGLRGDRADCRPYSSAVHTRFYGFHLQDCFAFAQREECRFRLPRSVRSDVGRVWLTCLVDGAARQLPDARASVPWGPAVSGEGRPVSNDPVTARLQYVTPWSGENFAIRGRGASWMNEGPYWPPQPALGVSCPAVGGLSGTQSGSEMCPDSEKRLDLARPHRARTSERKWLSPRRSST